MMKFRLHKIRDTLLSTGSGFAAAASWGAETDSEFSADFNGDGLADLLRNISSFKPSISVQYSTGNGFSAGTHAAYGTAIAAADVNGDSRADVILNNGSVLLSTSPTPDLLNSLTTGLGANTMITYKTIADTSVYTPMTGSVYPVRAINVNVPLYVVSSTSVSDGIGGIRSTNYKYTGAKRHLRGGGFLGFRQYDITDASTGIKTSTLFRQDYPYQGLPTSVTQTQAGGSPLKTVTNTWSFTTYSDTVLPIGTATGSKHHFPAVTATQEKTYGLSSELLTQVDTTTVHDAYGNATSVTTTSNDGYSKTITNTYSNDPVKWFIGRLTRSTVTSTIP